MGSGSRDVPKKLSYETGTLGMDRPDLAGARLGNQPGIEEVRSKSLATFTRYVRLWVSDSDKCVKFCEEFLARKIIFSVIQVLAKCIGGSALTASINISGNTL